MQIASNANLRAKLKLKSFLSRDPHNLTRVFVTYIHPLLEDCTPVWSPHFKGDINTIENVQRVLTCKVFRLCKLASADYEHRLHSLRP